MLAVELPIHQHPIDMNEALSAIQEVLSDLASTVTLLSTLIDRCLHGFGSNDQLVV